MTNTIQTGVIGYNNGNFADYVPFGGVHSFLDTGTGMCTVQGGFTGDSSWPIAANTALQFGGLMDATACPRPGAVHTGPASVRVGNKWGAGVVRITADGSLSIQSDIAGTVAECVFTLTYPAVGVTP